LAVAVQHPRPPGRLRRARLPSEERGAGGTAVFAAGPSGHPGPDPADRPLPARRAPVASPSGERRGAARRCRLRL